MFRPAYRRPVFGSTSDAGFAAQIAVDVVHSETYGFHVGAAPNGVGLTANVNVECHPKETGFSLVQLQL
jgi:hypothetical protein